MGRYGPCVCQRPASRGGRNRLRVRAMNYTFERVYESLPVGMQHLVCSAEGLRIQWMRFGRKFEHLLHDAEARSSMSAADLGTLRETLFQAFVSEAARGSTFYRRHPAFVTAAAGHSFSADDLPIL